MAARPYRAARPLTPSRPPPQAGEGKVRQPLHQPLPAQREAGRLLPSRLRRPPRHPPPACGRGRGRASRRNGAIPHSTAADALPASPASWGGGKRSGCSVIRLLAQNEAGRLLPSRQRRPPRHILSRLRGRPGGGQRPRSKELTGRPPQAAAERVGVTPGKKRPARAGKALPQPLPQAGGERRGSLGKRGRDNGTAAAILLLPRLRGRPGGGQRPGGKEITGQPPQAAAECAGMTPGKSRPARRKALPQPLPQAGGE